MLVIITGLRPSAEEQFDTLLAGRPVRSDAEHPIRFLGPRPMRRRGRGTSAAIPTRGSMNCMPMVQAEIDEPTRQGMTSDRATMTDEQVCVLLYIHCRLGPCHGCSGLITSCTCAGSKCSSRVPARGDHAPPRLSGAIFQAGRR
jgi:hypothetical protein